MLPTDHDLASACARAFGAAPWVGARTLPGPAGTLHLGLAVAGCGAAGGAEGPGGADAHSSVEFVDLDSVHSVAGGAELGLASRSWTRSGLTRSGLTRSGLTRSGLMPRDAAATEPGAAAVLCVTAPAAADPAPLLAVLSREEAARASGFVHDADRAAYVTVHALLRFLLAGRLGRAPAEIAFGRLTCACSSRTHSKPCLAPAPARETDLTLHFTLSRARGAVAVALGARPCGVDLEPEMTPAALAAVRGLVPASERQHYSDPSAATAAWVRKEALGKLAGTGIVESP
ncbi:hypothetical protein JT358_08805 [Micrococcales bacterium 31B]|nr:hypothetical protein [Micrococcales bacterium 31B]